jgi:hypothetical protein
MRRLLLKSVGTIILALIAFFIMLQTPAYAQSRNPEFTFEDLKALVSAKKISKLDDLVGELPLKIRSNGMLVYDSKALHQNRVGFETPRIILFNNDASLVMALTKNPGTAEIQAGEDDLEVLRFDHKTAKYEMFRVVFDGVNVPFDAPISLGRVESNPAKCLACHGSRPRPIFADYNSWPGFYGSFGQKGVAIDGTTENLELKKFVANAPSMARYRNLTITSRTDSNGVHLPSSGFGGLFDSQQFTPGLAFGAFTEFLMEKRIAMMMSKHSAFSGLRSTLSYLAASTCKTSRERVKDVYSAWVGSDSSFKLASTQILRKIEAQIDLDHKARETELIKFNGFNRSVNSRGLMNLAYEQIFIGSPPWAKLDKVFFQNQLVLMEALFRHFGLQSSDVSTTPGQPSSGIFHIRKLGVLKDEPYFELLADGFDDLDSTLLDRANSCSTLEGQMGVEITSLPMPGPTAGGVLFQ